MSVQIKGWELSIRSAVAAELPHRRCASLLILLGNLLLPACDGTRGAVPEPVEDSISAPLAVQEELPLGGDGTTPQPRAVHGVVPLGPDSVLLVVNPAPFLRLYAVGPDELALLAVAGDSGSGSHQLRQPWRATVFDGRIWIFDAGSSTGMISVWQIEPLEESDRFLPPARAVDILPACGGLAVVYQAQSGATWPTYGIAVREGGDWRIISPAPPDTVPAVLSWEDGRGVAVEDEVLYYGIDGALHHLPCSGSPPWREQIVPRSFATAAHGAAYDGRLLIQFFAPRRNRTATVAHVRLSDRPEGTEYQLEQDVRLHGFYFARFWLVRYRAGHPPALLRPDAAAMRRWIPWPAGEDERISRGTVSERDSL